MRIDLRKILYRLPLTFKMIFLTMAAGLGVAAWTEHHAQEAVEKLFQSHLGRELQQRSQEDRLRFDHHVRNFHQVARLAAVHQPFLTFLDQRDWFTGTRQGEIEIIDGLPPWLLNRSALRVLAVPRFVVLIDSRGEVRQIYSRQSQAALPDMLLHPSSLLLTKSHDQAYINNTDNTPLVLAAETVDNGDSRRVTLLVASPVDDQFLLASQATLPHQLVGLVDPDRNILLTSNNPELLPPGTSLDDLRRDFVVTGREYHDYGGAEMVVQLSSFVSTRDVREMADSFLANVSRENTMAAAVYIAVFAWIMLWISHRVGKLTHRVEEFSQQALGGNHQKMAKGDKLCVLGERFHLLTEEVLHSHRLIKQEAEERTARHHEVESNRRQIKLLETVTDALGIGVMIREGAGYQAANNRMAHYRRLCDDLCGFAVEPGNSEEKTITGPRGDCFIFQVSSPSLFRDREVILVSDITAEKKIEAERERLRAELCQAQKMESIGRLAGGVAHDFNNMLTTINGYAQLALMKIEDDAELKRDLDVIIESSDMAAELTKQLLAFSRKQVIRPFPLVLNDVLAGLGKMLGRLIGADIRVTVVPAEGLWAVMADKTQIEQILMNLSLNARDAMPRGGELVIETANVTVDDSGAARHREIEPGDYVRLSVTDTGTGIAKGDLNHIFEPFFTTKELGKGTGLGLATVYGIVKQSNGSIYVYSEPGTGTTFKIYLPALRGAVENRVESADREAPRGTETILVAEDDPRVRQFVVTVLTGLGYTVMEADNGREAEKLCTKHRDQLDLLLTDVVLPGLRGGELARELTAAGTGPRVLFMTGYTDNSMVHLDILERHAPLLQKPLTPLSVAKAVRQALDDGKENAGRRT